MSGTLHLVKLSVGSESVEQMIDWQQNRSSHRLNGHYYHLTRMFPKRAEELLDGGSIFWVVQGVCQARQRILALEELVGEDGIRRCAVVLDDEMIRVEPTRKRPFQGWRYLPATDAPRDLSTKSAKGAKDLPPKLMAALAEIGVR